MEDTLFFIFGKEKQSEYWQPVNVDRCNFAPAIFMASAYVGEQAASDCLRKLTKENPRYDFKAAPLSRAYNLTLSPAGELIRTEGE